MMGGWEIMAVVITAWLASAYAMAVAYILTDNDLPAGGVWTVLMLPFIGVGDLLNHIARRRLISLLAACPACGHEVFKTWGRDDSLCGSLGGFNTCLCRGHGQNAYGNPARLT